MFCVAPPRPHFCRWEKALKSNVYYSSRHAGRHFILVFAIFGLRDNLCSLLIKRLLTQSKCKIETEKINSVIDL